MKLDKQPIIYKEIVTVAQVSYIHAANGNWSFTMENVPGRWHTNSLIPLLKPGDRVKITITKEPVDAPSQ